MTVITMLLNVRLHEIHSLFSVQFDVHSDVPFTLDPAFLQALLTDVDLVVNKTDTARELKFTVCSPPPPASNCVTTRFPLYGQTDGRIDIGGSLFSAWFLVVLYRR